MKTRTLFVRQEKLIFNFFILALLISTFILTGCESSRSTNANRADTKQHQSTSTTTNTAVAAGTTASSDMSTSRVILSGEPSFASDEAKASAERYAQIHENPFLDASRAPLSTFSIDVDTASYSNVRRYLNDGQLPPRDAVRIEELINYFQYDYPQPLGNEPFSVTTEAAACPWNVDHKLVLIGLQGRKVSLDNVPPSNLVFLVDVSGSMNDPKKLPLLKQSLKTLVNQLSVKDRVAIVVYAGSSGLVLPSTTADRKGEVLAALENLEAGGSTNGGQGIQLAYRIAAENFVQNGNNRVVLATDGDFNVGLTGDDELVRLIEQKRQSGVFLSVLGFGTGNTNDSMMEKLADKGNGNYAYIDSLDEARKALGEQAAGTLYTIAKDVKIQVEFNPARVAGYRLIGYENRLLADRDFNDDRKDAGEVGAGISVTALYEVVPTGQKLENPGVDELKYVEKAQPVDVNSNEMLTVKLRYKEPSANESKLLQIGLIEREKSFEAASANLQFAASVAEFGLLLRDSRYKGTANFDKLLQIAQNASGNDLKNHRAEFIELVGKAKSLAARQARLN